MNLLILGGTVFLGRAITEAALALGHTVTHFNRGRSGPGLFEGVETLIGDRDGGLAPLANRTWDAVADTCGYVPRVVGQSAEFLAHQVEHYAFISSLSVYQDFGAPSSEGSKVIALADETVEEVTGDTYGGLKVLCEKAVERALPGRSLHVRAGLIVGPNDPTGRFTYWPVRVARGKKALAPGRPEARVQFIDVRDLGEWIVHGLAERLTGPYNVTGPAESLTMRAFLESCRDTANPDAELCWVDDATLERHEVEPWVELPLWIPGVDMQADCRKARKAGLTFTPLEKTIRDTLDWARTSDAPLPNTLSAERERAILDAVG